MKTIRVMAPTFIRGVPVFTGDMVSVDDADARLLIQYEKAEITDEILAGATEDEDKKVITKRRNK